LSSSSPTVGVLLSRVRVEEKLLLQELSSRGVDTKVIDDRELVLPTEAKPDLGQIPTNKGPLHGCADP